MQKFDDCTEQFYHFVCVRKFPNFIKLRPLCFADNRNGMMQGNESSHQNQNNQYYPQSGGNPNYGPQYGRQYQQPYAQQYPQGHAQPQQQNRNYVNPASAAAAPSASSSSSSSSQQQQHPKQAPHESYVRNVPIVFETTGTPINRTADTGTGTGQSPPTQQQHYQPQTASGKPRPEPLNKDSFANVPLNQPIPCPPAQQQQPDQQQHSGESL